MDDKKQYLCRYHNLQVRIEKKKQLIEEYRRLSHSIPGPNYGNDMPRNPNRNLSAPFEKWIYLIIEEEDKLKVMESELVVLKDETMKAINTVNNDDYKMVLIYRYIDWLGWNEIARKIYGCVKTARRYHDKGLEMITI